MTPETAARLIQIIGILIIFLQWGQFRRFWHKTTGATTLFAVVFLCLGLTFGTLVKLLVWASGTPIPANAEKLPLILDTMALMGIALLGINWLTPENNQDEDHLSPG